VIFLLLALMLWDTVHTTTSVMCYVVDRRHPKFFLSLVLRVEVSGAKMWSGVSGILTSPQICFRDLNLVTQTASLRKRHLILLPDLASSPFLTSETIIRAKCPCSITRARIWTARTLRSRVRFLLFTWTYVGLVIFLFVLCKRRNPRTGRSPKDSCLLNVLHHSVTRQKGIML
jgi:hypothetical protein